MVSIYALGGVCGANFNPAVSLSLMLCKKDLGPAVSHQVSTVAIYMAVQIAAGIVAGLAYHGILYNVDKPFNLQPGAGYSWWQAFIVEILYTFMLCFVVLNTAAAKARAGKNEFYGLAIGFVIIAGGYAGGHISGGAFNPAVAIGIDLSSANLGFGWCILYTLAEFIGAAIAAGLFHVVRPDENVEEKPLSAKLASEFIGTYFLVLTVGLNVLGGSPAIVWSIAASLMCMIYALGDVSGAHFNPAVTTAILVCGKIDVKDACLYMVAQIVGGILAGLTYFGLEKDAFPLGPSVGFHTWQACVLELIFTFLLAFVVLSVAVPGVGNKGTKAKEIFGLAIGSCVTVGGHAIGVVSGGSLNPAVSIGIFVSSLLATAASHYVIWYVIAELAGGAAAAAIISAVAPREKLNE